MYSPTGGAFLFRTGVLCMTVIGTCLQGCALSLDIFILQIIIPQTAFLVQRHVPLSPVSPAPKCTPTILCPEVALCPEGGEQP